MRAISLTRWGWATWLGLAVACGGRPPGRTTPDPSASRVVSLASAIVLESSGPRPPDTALTLEPGAPRVIVMRHGPPDNIVFAELAVPARVVRAGRGPMRIEIRPRPGVYGLELASDVPFGSGATIIFKYPRYFVAPARAVAAYGSAAQFEEALVVGRVNRADSTITLLPSTRPAADNLAAIVPGPGTYLVVAAR